MPDSRDESPDELIPRTFEFGQFILVSADQLLLNNGRPVRIGNRSFAILRALLERPGETISKAELLANAWPGVFVEENNLKATIGVLRRLLGRGPDGSQFIASVSGRGYRFIAPVRRLSERPLPFFSGEASKRNNLPELQRRIFGRDAVVEAIGLDFQRSRLISIVGAGGVGKTTVAIAVASRLLSSFREGVWLVDLATIRDAQHVSNAIARSIGMVAHSSNMMAALVAFLRSQERLLVLDNCEHVLDEIASIVGPILGECPQVKILITSREPLSVPGERVRRLKGLETAPAGKHLTADEAMLFPAIQLFVERATERLTSFALSDTTATVVAEICRKLDGVALAIELVATQTGSFPIQDLLANVGARLLSFRGDSNEPERHRTLLATFEWSHDLLSDTEKLVLWRLSTFASTFGLNSACAVAGGSDLDRSAIVETTASLVAKSMIVVEPKEQELFYSLPNTMRMYTLEKLSISGEGDHARHRHARHVLQLTTVADADSKSLDVDEWSGRHGHMIDDLRLALQWAFSPPGDPILGVDITVKAVTFWKRLSLLDEGRTAVQLALADRFAVHRDRLEDAILNLALGVMELHTHGPLPHVKTSLTQALATAELFGSKDLQLECLRALSEFYLWTSDSHAALEASERIRAIAVEGDTTAEADADVQAGAALRWIGELDRSRYHLEKVINRPIAGRRRTEVGDFEFNQQLIAKGSLAQVLWLQGFPDRAVGLAREQLVGAEATNYAVSLCSALVQATAIALFVGDLEKADRHLVQLDSHAAEHHLTVWRSMGVCHRGRWLYDSGRPVDLEVFRDALTELHDAGFRMRYPAYLAHFSLGQAQHGDFDAAIDSIDEVMRRCESNGHSWGIPEALRLKASYLLGRHRSDSESDASQLLRRSMEMARHQGALSWELRSAIDLADIVQEASKRREESDRLAAIYARFTEGLDTVDLVRARRALQGVNASI